MVTPSQERVFLTADCLQGLDAGADFNNTLLNTLPTLWHTDHVVRLHTDFYDLVQDESCWDRTRTLTDGLERTDKIWIIHLREGDGLLCVCMDWKWRIVKCYNPLTGWEAYQRREKVKDVSCLSPTLTRFTNKARQLFRRWMVFLFDSPGKIFVSAESQEGPTLQEGNSADSGPWVMGMDRSLTAGETVFLEDTNKHVMEWRLGFLQLLRKHVTSAPA